MKIKMLKMIRMMRMTKMNADAVLSVRQRRELVFNCVGVFFRAAKFDPPCLDSTVCIILKGQI